MLECVSLRLQDMVQSKISAEARAVMHKRYDIDDLEQESETNRLSMSMIGM